MVDQPNGHISERGPEAGPPEVSAKHGSRGCFEPQLTLGEPENSPSPPYDDELEEKLLMEQPLPLDYRLHPAMETVNLGGQLHHQPENFLFSQGPPVIRQLVARGEPHNLLNQPENSPENQFGQPEHFENQFGQPENSLENHFLQLAMATEQPQNVFLLPSNQNQLVVSPENTPPKHLGGQSHISMWPPGHCGPTHNLNVTMVHHVPEGHSQVGDWPVERLTHQPILQLCPPQSTFSPPNDHLAHGPFGHELGFEVQIEAEPENNQPPKPLPAPIGWDMQENPENVQGFVENQPEMALTIPENSVWPQGGPFETHPVAEIQAPAPLPTVPAADVQQIFYGQQGIIWQGRQGLGQGGATMASPHEFHKFHGYGSQVPLLPLSVIASNENAVSEKVFNFSGPENHFHPQQKDTQEEKSSDGAYFSEDSPMPSDSEGAAGPSEMSQDEENTGVAQGVGVGGQSPRFRQPPPGQNEGLGPRFSEPTNPPAWFQKYADTTENLVGHVEKLAAKTQEIQNRLEGLGQATQAHLAVLEGQTASQLGEILPRVNETVRTLAAKITEDSEKRQAALMMQIGQLGAIPHPENVAKMLQFSQTFEEKLQKGLEAMDLRLAQMQSTSEVFCKFSEGLQKSVEQVRAENRAALDEVRGEVVAQGNFFRQAHVNLQKSVETARAENQAATNKMQAEMASQGQFFQENYASLENSVASLRQETKQIFHTLRDEVNQHQRIFQHQKAVFDNLQARLGVLETENPTTRNRLNDLERGFQFLFSAQKGPAAQNSQKITGGPSSCAPPVTSQMTGTKMGLFPVTATAQMTAAKMGLPSNTQLPQQKVAQKPGHLSVASHLPVASPGASGAGAFAPHQGSITDVHHGNASLTGYNGQPCPLVARTSVQGQAPLVPITAPFLSENPAPENQGKMVKPDPFSWAADGAGPEIRVRGIQTQPAAIAPVMASPFGSEFFLGPVGALLAKDLVKPEFRGNWHDFAVKFNLFLQNVSLAQNLTEEVKLMLLAGSLDQGSQLELQRRQELGERVQFQEFWNWLARRHGGDMQSSLRDDLRGLRLQNDGKLTLAAWRDFEAKFKLIYSRMENPAEEEAQNLVLSQLPDLLRKGIFRQQQKRDEQTPMLRLKDIPGLNLAKAKELVQTAIGSEEPVVVSESGSSFIIKLFSARARDLLMLRNNSSLAGGHQVRLTVHEFRFSLEEIFRHVENELRCQEKSDNLGRGWGGRPAPPTFDFKKDEPSQIFEVKIQDSRAPAQNFAPKAPQAPKNSEAAEKSAPQENGSDRGRPRERTGADRAPTPSPARSDGGARYSGQPGQGKGKGNERSASSHGKGGRGTPTSGKGWTPGKGKGGGQPGAGRQASRSPSRENPCANCGAPGHWHRDCPNGTWCCFCGTGTHTFGDCYSKSRAGDPYGPDRTPREPSRGETPARRRSA